jgi:hypothetical protein
MDNCWEQAPGQIELLPMIIYSTAIPPAQKKVLVPGLTTSQDARKARSGGVRKGAQRIHKSPLKARLTGRILLAKFLELGPIRGGHLTRAMSLFTPVRPEIRALLGPLFFPSLTAGLHLDIGFG